jgi:hypothetical protein
MIFKDNILLRKLFDKLRKKYSKLPHWTFTQEQEFSALTALSYFAHELNIKHFITTIDSLNKKINDVLEFDYEFWNDSKQKRRKIITKNKIPLLDSDWYEVVDFISREELVDSVNIISHTWNNPDTLPFNATISETEEVLSWKNKNIFYIKLANWITLRDPFLSPVDFLILNKAIITNNDIYFKIDGFQYFFNEKWKILSDNFWNYIDWIFWLKLLWDNEFALVCSNTFNGTYYINLDNKEIFFAKKKWIAQWVINKILWELWAINWVIYYQVESDWDIFIVDDQWNILLWDDWKPAFNIIWGIIISEKAFKLINEK